MVESTGILSLSPFQDPPDLPVVGFTSVKECPVKHRSTFEVALILDGFGKGLLCVFMHVVNVFFEQL